jgi:hypothetical protein
MTKTRLRLPLCGATRIVRCETFSRRDSSQGRLSAEEGEWSDYLRNAPRERLGAHSSHVGLLHERCWEFLIDLNEPEGIIRWPTSLAGVNVGAAIYAKEFVARPYRAARPLICPSRPGVVVDRG